jgi:hypothetical protein
LLLTHEQRLLKNATVIPPSPSSSSILPLHSTSTSSMLSSLPQANFVTFVASVLGPLPPQTLILCPNSQLSSPLKGLGEVSTLISPLLIAFFVRFVKRQDTQLIDDINGLLLHTNSLQGLLSRTDLINLKPCLFSMVQFFPTPDIWTQEHLLTSPLI